MSYTIAEIASHIGAILKDDGQSQITGIAPLQSATSQQITFLDNPLYQHYLKETKAAAVIYQRRCSRIARPLRWLLMNLMWPMPKRPLYLPV